MNLAAVAAFIIAGATVAFAQSRPAPATPPPSGKSERPSPAIDNYLPGPDSQRQPGVPAGKIFSLKFDDSKIFPGTTRTISVYIPAQYKAEKPACVYIALDGLGFDAPTVFDNLIHRNEMPVTIGIGISPGQVASGNAPADPRFNRSLEFDSLDDSLARFVLEEVLPEVEKQKTPDGLPILLSKDPNDRCTAGGSTGAIAAFTLAWQRPDAFRRVFSAIGTYVGMRGGDRYPVLVRKTEPKPIRIFQQDGSSDEWMGGPEVGDWWMSNQTLARAFEFSGYECEHVWGTGPHSGRHAAAIFPDAMRFLWKDWPQPVKAGQTQNTFLKAILLPGEDWQLAAGGFEGPDQLASDPSGDVVFQDIPNVKAYALAQGTGAPIRLPVGDNAGAMSFGPDGKLYVAHSATSTIFEYDFKDPKTPPTATERIVRADATAGQLVVRHDGAVYEVGPKGGNNSALWLLHPGPERKEDFLDSGLYHLTSVAISPDGLWLAAVEEGSHVGYSYRVKPDCTLDAMQRFYWFHVPDDAEDSGASSLCFDRDGRLYAATRMGIQVLDRNGRTRAILPLPGNPAVTSICFGGPQFDTLFAAAGGNVYRRKMNVPGAPPWAAPIKLPPWGAG